MKYGEWLDDWLCNYVKLSVKVRTYERYALIVKLHICEELGDYEMDRITPVILQRYVSELICSGNRKTGGCLSANSVNSIIYVVQNSLRIAHLFGFLDSYSADKIKRPRVVEKSVDCFSHEEQKKVESFVLNSKKDKLLGIIICLYTGLRIGELLALNWKDIDFNDGTINIDKSCYDSSKDGEHIRVIDTPKTIHSKRVIPLPKQIVSLLKMYRKRSLSEYLIADCDKPVFVRSYQRTFELLLKKLSISHKGFHSLRHTFATRAIECGMDVKTLSEILGHKDATVTLSRYTHSLLEHKTEMMNKIGKLL